MINWIFTEDWRFVIINIWMVNDYIMDWYCSICNHKLRCNVWWMEWICFMYLKERYLPKCLKPETRRMKVMAQVHDDDDIWMICFEDYVLKEAHCNMFCDYVLWLTERKLFNYLSLPHSSPTFDNRTYVNTH